MAPKINQAILQDCPATLEVLTEAERQDPPTFSLAQASEQADFILRLLRMASQPSSMAKADVKASLLSLRLSFSPALPLDFDLPSSERLFHLLLLRAHAKKGKEAEEGGIPSTVKGIEEAAHLISEHLEISQAMREQAYDAPGWPHRTAKLTKDFHLLRAR